MARMTKEALLKLAKQKKIKVPKDATNKEIQALIDRAKPTESKPKVGKTSEDTRFHGEHKKS